MSDPRPFWRETGQTSGVFTTGYEAGYGIIVGQHQLLKIY